MGVVALVLSAMGIYGLTAHLVAGQRREIGIRLALGATGSTVLRGILLSGLLRASRVDPADTLRSD